MPVFLIDLFKNLFSFISSPAGKIAEYVVGALAVLAILFGILKVHDDSIRTEAVAEQSKAQLEQVITDNARVTQQLNAIQATQSQIVEAVNKKNTDVKTKAATVRAYIASPEAQKSDRPASDILKNTIKGLSQ